MFDFTKEISLGPSSRLKYNIARFVLYAAFCAGVLFTINLILFPMISLVFSFDNANSLKNTLVFPRTAANPGEIAKNQLATGDTLVFNANPVGNFSETSIKFSIDKNSPSLEGISVKLRKSYQTFFYPSGHPMGFRNGTLLTTDDGLYFMVSDGRLRRFSSTDIILKLGYSKSAFLPVDKNDLQYNENGADITDAATYPDNTFFAIGDTYYELKNQQLFPFASTRAFFSQYEAIQAILKNSDFLNQYQISETALGFADGTLASFDQSAFILSDGKNYPIANVSTFLSMGFDFNNVIALDSEEMGIYERQKQFSHDQPHPNGTLFLDQKTQEFSVIENGKRRPIKSAAIANTYSKQKPILADSQESEESVACSLKKYSFFGNVYSCQTPIDPIEGNIGNSYQIDTTFSTGAKIKNINATFSTPIAWKNFRSSLSLIKTRLINNYITPMP